MNNDFKRELSRLSGVDFFNPKYREVFKKYLPEEKSEDEERDEELEETESEQTNEKEEPAVQEENNDNLDEEKDVDKVEEEPADNTEESDEQTEESFDSQCDGNEVEEKKAENTADALLEAKIENALLRGGVREEKLGSAMRLAKSEITSLDELDKVQEILKDFPEWVRGYKPTGFGMEVDNGSDNLTEEEKRLKAMGIDPRD